MVGDSGVHPRNKLNDLPGRDWLRFTKSWFVCDSRRYHRNRATELHPARFPEEMVAQFLSFFTKAGEWVLDPFVGSGATLVSCAETGRRGVGVEIASRYADMAAERARGQSVICGDAARMAEPSFWNGLPAELERTAEGLPVFDFVMTSPPYWNMLRRSRGNVFSTHQERDAKGLDTHYTDEPADLGNEVDYRAYIERTGRVFDVCARLLRPGRYMVVIAQNLRAPDGEVKPLAWDLQARISQSLLFQGERIWCQDSKRLGIWGYPSVFVPNYHHHYCLVFRKHQQAA
ncbi:MAG: DNA methyltransferase [Armatimonadota bacterium]